MAYWLFKSEPGAWSWQDQLRRGALGEPWNGVRNHQAANHMKAMRRGDLGFFYHSVTEKRIVGIVEVIGEYEPDPGDDSGRFGMVRVSARMALPRPVDLAAIRAEPALRDLPLLRQARLSVMPIGEEEWRLLCRMGGLETAP